MGEIWDVVDACGRPTGRVHEKGRPMRPGEYHRSVSVWLMNSRGEYLISRRRTDDSLAPGKWETAGGSALAGEECIDAAVREVWEELGITLRKEDGRLFTAYLWPHSDGSGAAYTDALVFSGEDYEPGEIGLSEVSEVMTADADCIRRLIAGGEMIPYTYAEELFAFSEAARKERKQSGR